MDVLEEQIPHFMNPSCVCDATETISKFRDIMIEEAKSRAALPMPQNNATTEKADIEEEEEDRAHSGTDERGRIDSVLSTTCDRCLSSLASRSIELIGVMSVQHLRRLLMVYSSSPFRADRLVDEIEREVQERSERLRSILRSKVSFENELVAAVAPAQELRRTIRGDAGSPFAAIRSGLRSFFRKKDRDGQEQHVENYTEAEEEEEAEDQTKQELERVDRALRSIINLGEYAEALTRATSSSLDKTTRGMEQEALFELGRCSELVAHYRRIVDFESGRREDRYDVDTRRAMAKRVLSRLLPR